MYPYRVRLPEQLPVQTQHFVRMCGCRGPFLLTFAQNLTANGALTLVIATYLTSFFADTSRGSYPKLRMNLLILRPNDPMIPMPSSKMTTTGFCFVP